MSNQQSITLTLTKPTNKIAIQKTQHNITKNIVFFLKVYIYILSQHFFLTHFIYQLVIKEFINAHFEIATYMFIINYNSFNFSLL